MEQFIQQITKKAGLAIKEEYGEIGVKYAKDTIADVVTEADLISTKIITEAIRKNYPDHGIISEETDNHQEDADYLWIIDPLDGTRNFASRNPMFGVMVALAHKKDLQMAALFAPIQDEFFFAQKGKGAFRNGQQIHSSQTKEWKHSYGCCATYMRGDDKIRAISKLVNYALKETFWMNQLGSVCSSVLLVADGRRDWYFSAGAFIWDYAAPALLLKEAGCKVTNLSGDEWQIDDRELIAANKFLHPKLLKIIND